MEKLIELLNEHRVELAHGNIQNQTMWHYNGYVFGFGDLNSQNCVLLIISKEYGFIKWLVDNDKIDFDKCGLDIKDYLSYNKRYNKGIVMAENYNNDTFVVREFYSPYEQLLMLLSIQDNPIEFLISVLR